MKQPPKVVPKRNLRADARRLYPNWSRRMQAKWVLARLRVLGGTWATQISVKANRPDYVPDFLRQLPAGPQLVLVEDYHDKIRKARALVKGTFKWPG